MKHIIVIDDSSRAGKNLLELAEILSVSDQTISLLTTEEDDALLSDMLTARASGILNTDEKSKFIDQLREQVRL